MSKMFNDFTKGINSRWKRWKAHSKAYRSWLIWPFALATRRKLFINILGTVIPRASGGLILDVGTGPGDFVFMATEAYPEIHCVGVDINEDLLEIASHRSSHSKEADRISFKRANVDSLPFQNESFDLVFSAMSIYQWQDRQAGLQEIFRVLKKSGFIVILVGTGYLTNPIPIIDVIFRLSEKYLTKLFESVGFKNIQHSYPRWNVIQVIGQKV